MSRAGAAGSGHRAPVSAVALADDDWLPDGRPDPLADRRGAQIGAPLSRLDGPRKVAGAAPFVGDITVEGMVYATIVHSTIARGQITGIDTATAEAAPGVLFVMTYLNAPRLNPPPLMQTSLKAGSLDTRPVMQDERIHWNGQPVALVVAETQEHADHAASSITTAYETDAASTDFDAARRRGAEPVVIAGMPMHFERGDARTAFDDAPVTFDGTYSTPSLNHNAIELHTVTAAWEDSRLRIHDATQQVTHTAWSLAQIFDMDEADVVVTSPFVGGGFGGKMLWQHQILAAAAARVVERPVRLVVPREGVYRLVGGRSRTVQRVALGADREGHLRSLLHEGVSPTSGAGLGPEAFILSSFSAYGAETMAIGLETVHLDTLSNSMMRAPGEAVGSIAIECAMDELAYELGIDPIELRVRNEAATDPLTGKPFSMRNVVQAWREGSQHFGWSRRQATPGVVRDGEWLVGMGCAMASHAYHRRAGGAARLTLTRDGRAIVEVAAHEMGMGTATVQAQICADRLGMPLDAIDFRYGDSRLPGAVLAGSSHQTAVIGAAVASAQRELVATLLQLAGPESPIAGLTVDQVGAHDCGLSSLADPQRFDTYDSILERAGRDAVSAEVASAEPQEERLMSMRSYGALFCEVRVNAVTGETRVSRFLGSYDCGRIMNPKTAASQLRGGIIMGLGLSLMEEAHLDGRNGRIMNANIADYHIPVHADVPVIDVMWTDIPDPHTPMGGHGIGEIGITGVGAAVANAVFNATGRRVRDFPITLDKVM